MYASLRVWNLCTTKRECIRNQSKPDWNAARILTFWISHVHMCVFINVKTTEKGKTALWNWFYTLLYRASFGACFQEDLWFPSERKIYLRFPKVFWQIQKTWQLCLFNTQSSTISLLYLSYSRSQTTVHFRDFTTEHWCSVILSNSSPTNIVLILL